MKKNNIIKLSSLYLNFSFQKVTIIIFSLSLILMTTFMFIISNPWITNEEYLLNYEGFHDNYFRLSLLIIEIFNGIIIASFIITLIINANSFDFLFISNNKRMYLSISKIITLLLILFALTLFEFIILNVVALTRYSLYKININSILILLFIFLSMIFEAGLSMLLTTLVNSIFIPMIILFVGIIIRLLSSSFPKIEEITSKIFPIINISGTDIIFNSYLTTPILSILFYIIYVFYYNIKDLKD